MMFALSLKHTIKWKTVWDLLCVPCKMWSRLSVPATYGTEPKQIPSLFQPLD